MASDGAAAIASAAPAAPAAPANAPPPQEYTRVFVHQPTQCNADGQPVLRITVISRRGDDMTTHTYMLAGPIPFGAPREVACCQVQRHRATQLRQTTHGQQIESTHTVQRLHDPS